MPSPFPGMDPYIESSKIWGDFHGSLLAFIRSDLNQRLPAGFAASIDLLVWTEASGSSDDARLGEPDVFVQGEREQSRHGQKASANGAAPATIVLPRLLRKKRKYIKVVDIRSKKVVTVVEVLSPANKKSGKDRAAYLEKRSEYFGNNLSFVEIDLLRSGRRPPLGSKHPEVIDYYAMVCRSWEFPRAGFWTFSIRDPIPRIPVPVKRGSSDTYLNLKWCVDQAYDGGRYSTNLAYDEPLSPSACAEDRDWISKVLKKLPSHH